MPFAMTSNITSGFLQGAGDVGTPAAASLVNQGVRLGATWLMAKTFIDFRSIYFSMPPAWIIGCLIIVARYRSGRWRKAGLT
jgi:Na+-driven multidrug efflux pump